MIIEETGLVAKDGGRIPLEGVEVRGELCGGFARVKVIQRYRNTEPKPIEAVYTFPLPTDGTLTGFAMTANGRRLEGVVKEREQAFTAYDDAITAGHGAALLEQERPNVFTCSVGNLLPGEETRIEIAYVQRLAAEEGSLRWMIPSLVAPRFVPGQAKGDRTAGGRLDPTDRVPDADRISPPIGEVAYGLVLDLLVDVGDSAEVSSPSHALDVVREGQKQRVRFRRAEVPLDRDVVVNVARTDGTPLTSAFVHAGKFLALSVVADLSAVAQAEPQPQRVVFVIDVSGSMGGQSLAEAQAALKLCLRHLREGDRFGIIAFESSFEQFRPELVGFTDKTLAEADLWVHRLMARGGTEMLSPLLAAAKLAAGGVVVLLTDGQVGNEDEIAAQVLQASQGARCYSFGIGTNVSDALLRTLGRETGGAVELIHPGERIDDKVVAQFSRAIARRVTDVKVTFDGVELGELAPAQPAALVDGDPWTLLGKLEGPGRSGRAEIRGKLGDEPFFLSVPFDAAGDEDHPMLPYLWAAERVRDLEGATLSGRRADKMKERITAIAVEHGIASRHTSFVVIETRTGDRRAPGQPETRVVPVNTPAGWAMFERAPVPQPASRGRAIFLGAPAGAPPPPMMMSAPVASLPRADLAKRDLAPSVPMMAMPAPITQAPADPVVTLLARQLASGLWPGADEAAQVTATVETLLELLGSADPKVGAQVKKAVQTLLAIVPRLPPALATRALGIAWLSAAGPRTRREIEGQIRAHASALIPLLGDQDRLRAAIA